MHPGSRGSSSLPLLILLAALLLAAGCTGTPAPAQPRADDSATAPPGIAWEETVLADLNGQGNFTLGSFAGSTVIVPVVSVSCSTCIPQLNRQVAEAGTVARAGNGSIAIVVLDLDPAGGPDFLTAYGGRKTFTGRSARAPPAMASAIFSRFGPFAVDTPSIPVILICPGGRDLLLPPGLKNATALSGAIAREC